MNSSSGSSLSDVMNWINKYIIIDEENNIIYDAGLPVHFDRV